MEQWFAIAILIAAALGLGAWTILRGYLGLDSGKKADRRQAARETAQVAIERFTTLVNRVFPQSRADRRGLAVKIAAAGQDITPETFRARSWIAALCAAAFLLALGALFGANGFMLVILAVIGLGAGLVLPRAMLERDARRRRQQIEGGLPSALDMLSAAVSSGLTIERAMEVVSRRSDGPIAHEFGRAVTDISNLNYSTAQALSKMEARCRVESVTLFCASVAQALAQGSPISDVLAGQASIARVKYFQHIEEKANKLPPKMVLPLVLFILPGTIIIAMAPAAIQIMNVIGAM